VASAPAASSIITSPTVLFNGNSGRWATQQLYKAMTEGKGLTTAALRTLDTLRHEEWKYFDDAVVRETVMRLVGVKDLISAGFTRNVPNALAKTVFGYEQVTDMDAAITSLDGLGQTDNDVQEFNLNQLPLPITHKDYFINLRKLAAARLSGETLDTIQAQTAARVVSEQLEKMLFQGGPTFGGLPIYGYTTHPNRVTTVSFDGGKDWGDSTKAGSSYLKDLLAAITALQANKFFGPYWVYMPTDAGVIIDNDYNAATANIQSIRGRISQVSSVQRIGVADQLPSGNLIVMQASPDVAAWIQGEQIQNVQWDEAGGFKLNFKVFSIGAPLIRATASGKSGICHLNG
jgi:hypothetical protein